MNTPHHDNTPDSSPTTSSVDSVLTSLASKRWTGEPDWRSLQEKLMLTRTFGWKRFALVSLFAAGCFAAGAVTTAVWDNYTFSGTMHLNNGESVPVSGKVISVDPNAPGSMEVELHSDGKSLASGGSMQIVTPDGRTATLMTAPADAKPGPDGMIEVKLPNGKTAKYPAPSKQNSDDAARCKTLCGNTCTGKCKQPG